MKPFAYMEMRSLWVLLASLVLLPLLAADETGANAASKLANTNAAPAASRSLDDALSLLRNAVETSSTLTPPAEPTTAAIPAPAETNAAPAAPGPNSIESLDDKIKLNAGDILRFRIIEDREEVKPLRVTDAGDLDVPYIGPVLAKGRTCRDIAGEIKRRLEADYYYTATVSLAVDQVAKKTFGRIWVTGQVLAQGPQEIPGDETWTVYKAVLRSGGFNDFANKGKVKLLRPVKGADGVEKREEIIVDVAAVMKGRAEKDVQVQDGDHIIVDAQLINFR